MTFVAFQLLLASRRALAQTARADNIGGTPAQRLNLRPIACWSARVHRNTNVKVERFGQALDSATTIVTKTHKANVR